MNFNVQVQGHLEVSETLFVCLSILTTKQLEKLLPFITVTLHIPLKHEFDILYS